MIVKRLCLLVLLCGAAAGAAAAASTPAPAPAPLAAPAPSAPGPIPFKHDGMAPAGSLSGGAAGVLLVSFAAIAAVLLIRRRLRFDGVKGGPAQLVKVLETQRLGPRTLLTVVEFGGRQHLIAQSEHGVQCLATAELPGSAGAPP